MNLDDKGANNKIDILIIDDDPRNLNLVSLMLRKNNYDVRLASDAEIALRSIKAKLPFLILLDIQLPGMSGYELCRILKEDNSTKEIPVVFLSAYSSTDEKLKGFEVGGIDYMAKPFDVQEVLVRVQTQVTLRKLQLESEQHNSILLKEIEEHKLDKEKLIQSHELINALLEQEKKNKNALLSILHDNNDTLKFLRESEEKFKELFDNAPIGYHELDIEGRITRVNITELNMLGYTEEEMIGQYVWKFAGDENSAKQRVLEKLKEIRPPAKNQESVYRRKDLTTFPILVEEIILRDASDNITGIRTTIQDITQRKRSEEEITMLAHSLRSINECVSITDLEDKIIFVNESFLTTYGYMKDELIGKHINIVRSQNNPPEIVKEILPATIHEGWKGELWNRRKDGSEFPIYLSTTIINDKDGKPLGLIGVAQDITERKRAEEEISRMANILEATPDLVGMADLHGNVFYLNRGGKLLMGMPAYEEITKLKISDFHPDDIVQLIMREGLPTATKKGFWSTETKLLSTAGEEIPVLQVILSHRNSNDIITHYSTIARDIREIKRAEEKLLKLSLAVEQSPASVVITNAKGDIEYVNERFCELLGYTKEEMIGKNTSILKSGHHSKSFYEELWNTILSGKVWRGEILNKKKNGETYWESGSISPLVNKEGEITHFVAMKEDITEKVTMISDLFVAKEKAEQSDKLKTAFLAQMSHEIRTPLNAIIGNADYLNEVFREKMDADSRDSFEGIHLASERMIRTVDLILNAAELQTSSYERHFVKVNLNSDILYKLYLEYQLSAKQKGLKFIYTCKEKETNVTVDAYSVTQIFSNLIDNAIKYTKNGKIEMLLGKNRTGNIMVEVKDTGIGISKEFLPRMFDPFVQEEQGYTRSYEGNGLGLTLIKKYCELNHAIIEVESEKNVGSTFRIIFDEEVTEGPN